VVASSACGQAAIQLQGSLPFAFRVLGCAVPLRLQAAVLARESGVLLTSRDEHSFVAPGSFALHRRVRHAPGQSVVGASRRSAAPGSQQLGAATRGSAGSASVSRPRPIGSSGSRASRLARPESVPRVMLNPSIERTLPGKPVSASHVKR
jgi:hypothetical protein